MRVEHTLHTLCTRTLGFEAETGPLRSDAEKVFEAHLGQCEGICAGERNRCGQFLGVR